MDSVLDGALTLAIGLAVALTLMLLIVGSRITRIALRRIALRSASRDETPAATRAALDAGAPALAELGFQYRFTTAQNDAAAAIDHTHYTDVYEHADGRTHALVSQAPMGVAGEPFRVNFLSLVENRPALLTMNCRMHEWMVPYPDVETRDPYVATLGEAWRFHQQRLAREKGRILTDGPAFFHAYKVIIEKQMKHGERSGVLRRQGSHWFMPWRAAIPYAVRWNLAQRRVAKVRRQAPAAPTTASAAASGAAAAVDPGASRVEADVALYEKHVALKESLRWSSRRKWQIFAISAVLFLGVGSLWFSWTFLPILLAVIALHEGGHFLAMKLSGYGNLSVFFVPGLGGMATGEKPSAGPWEKMFVYLAGPVPGIALATAGLIGMLTGHFQPSPWFSEFLFACLIINYLNLLPVTPLDGGRIVETFLFARLPVARFGFAVLGFLLLLAFGLSNGDRVTLVIAAMIGLGLPHHWRLMQVDRAVERKGDEVLSRRGATERVFMALQAPKFAKWDGTQRITVVDALLPELQGRRARPLEAAGGLVVYVVFLIAPIVLAVQAFPNGWQVAGQLTGLNPTYVPDDVDPPSEREQQESANRKDWFAQADRAESLPEPRRLEVLLAAAEQADTYEESERRERYVRAAWTIVQSHAPESTDRARVTFLLSKSEQDEARRTELLQQLLREQEGATQPQALVLRARAREQLSWQDNLAPADKVVLLQKVVEDFEAAKHDVAETQVARNALASAYDTSGQAPAAEALLRRMIEVQPVPAAADRSRAGLDSKVAKMRWETQLAWFLITHDRAAEAMQLLEASAARLPERITASWQYPQGEIRQAQVWAALRMRNPAGAKAAWERWDATHHAMPGAMASLTHELDRFAVARALGDSAMEAKARKGVRDAMESRSNGRAPEFLCSPPAGLDNPAAPRRVARAEAAKAMGLCAKT